MSDQYRYSEGGSSFHEGHGGQIIDNSGAEIAETHLSEAENENTHFTYFNDIPGQIPSFGDEPSFTGNESGQFLAIPLSEAENESTYSTDLSNISGQIPSFGDEPSFTGNENGDLLDIAYSWHPSSQTEYYTNLSTEFSGSGLYPPLEGYSSFTENVGGLDYDPNAAATLDYEEYNETRNSTNLSNPDQNHHFGDGWSYPDGAGEQFSDASGAEFLNNAAYDAKAPLYPDMMPQPAVGPMSGYNWQDASQPGDNYNIGPSDSDRPNASPPQPRKHGRAQSGDNYHIGPSDPDQSNASSPQPRKHRRTRSGDDDNIGLPDPDQSNESPPQPQKKPERKRWTEEDDGKILTRVKHRIDIKEIAKELERTVASCRYRKRQLELLDKSKIESLIKAQEVADAIAQPPTDVPVLRMKNASRVDWATPGMKDTSCVDLETPGLYEWIGRRVKALRDLKGSTGFLWAYHHAADNLNEVNNTNLSGQDLRDIEIRLIRAQGYS